MTVISGSPTRMEAILRISLFAASDAYQGTWTANKSALEHKQNRNYHSATKGKTTMQRR